MGVEVLVVACFGYFEAEGDLAGEGLVFHENRQEKLFKFISAERFQVQEIDNDAKDLLQVVKFIASYILALPKKLLDFTGSPPHVLLFLGINEDIVPGSLEDHFGVLDQFVEQFIFYLAVEVRLKDLDEVDRSFVEFNELGVGEEPGFDLT